MRDKFVELITSDDKRIYVRKSSIIKVWVNGNLTMVQYYSGATDSFKMPIKQLLRKIK